MKIKSKKSKLIITTEIDLADRDQVRDEIIRIKWVWSILTRIWRRLEL